MRKSLQLLGGNLRSFSAEQCRHYLLRGTFEKSLDQVPQSRPPRYVTRHRWQIDIARPVLLVPNVPFLFQHSQLSAHRRIMFLPMELVEHVRNACAAKSIENIHDLPFTPRERR